MRPLITLAMLCATILATPAMAQVPPEPFSDGLSARAPITTSVQLSHALLIGPTIYHFTDLTTGVPIWHNRSRRFYLGATVAIGTTVLRVKEEERHHLTFRNLAGDLWMTLTGPARSAHHSFAFGIGGPLNDMRHRTFFLNPSEATLRLLTVTYGGYVPTDWVDLSYGAAWGWNDVSVIHFHIYTSMVLNPIEPLGIRFGIAGGAGPIPWTTVTGGIQIRPIPGLEIGLGVAAMLEDHHLDGPPLPQLEVKWWDEGARR